MSGAAHLPVRIGTAGWNIPKSYAAHFPLTGTHLQRYAAVFPAVEINSSFYRAHKPITYQRWSESVPKGFRFSAKVPREITHQKKLVDAADLLKKFLGEVTHLGERLGPLLVQLPPSFRYEKHRVEAFFSSFRALFDGQIVCEPRHATWFSESVDKTLYTFKVGRVAADPACVRAAARPGGWPELAYWRLHGSPKLYYSTYESAYLAQLKTNLSSSSHRESWCIFDNTALGEATGNALDLRRLSTPNRQCG